VPGLTALWIKFHIRLLKPIITNSNIEAEKSLQNKLGELAKRIFKSDVSFQTENMGCIDAVWVRPRVKRLDKVILYLHGGGYVSGDIIYTSTFGGVLADCTGIDAFCPVYRLAPEHRFPAALDDAYSAYRQLIDKYGYKSNDIYVMGESAGGGLAAALVHYLKSRGEGLPRGCVLVSPWSDLALTGKSHDYNAKKEVSLSTKQLKSFALMYADEENLKNELVSPLFGDFTSFPPMLIIAGGDEILLDDAVSVYEKALAAGAKATLLVEKGMWHAYPMYRLKESRKALYKIVDFVFGEENNE